MREVKISPISVQLVRVSSLSRPLGPEVISMQDGAGSMLTSLMLTQ